MTVYLQFGIFGDFPVKNTVHTPYIWFWPTLQIYHACLQRQYACLQRHHACLQRYHACLQIYRVGQNCLYTPYMTVYLMISLSKIPYIHRIYMVLANPTNISCLPAKISLAKISCLPAKMSYVTSQSQGVVGPVIAWCASWLHHRAHTHIQMPTWPHYRAHTHIQTSTCRVGQNRIYTYIYTVYLMISKPKIPYVHRIYVWFWLTLRVCLSQCAATTINNYRQRRPGCRSILSQQFRIKYLECAFYNALLRQS